MMDEISFGAAIIYASTEYPLFFNSSAVLMGTEGSRIVPSTIMLSLFSAPMSIRFFVNTFENTCVSLGNLISFSTSAWKPGWNILKSSPLIDKKSVSL